MSIAWSKKVEVLFIGDSHCPGTEYVFKEHILAAQKTPEIGDLFEVKAVFAGHMSVDPKTRSISCIHGDNECQGNIALTCEAEYAPSEIVSLTLCHTLLYVFNEDSIHSCMEASSVPVEVQERVLRCVNSGEGEKLILEALKKYPRYEELPALFVNGVQIIDFKKFELPAKVCEATQEMDRPRKCNKRMRQFYFDAYDPSTKEFCYLDSDKNNWNYYNFFYRERRHIIRPSFAPDTPALTSPLHGETEAESLAAAVDSLTHQDIDVSTTQPPTTRSPTSARPKTLQGWIDRIQSVGVGNALKEFVSDEGAGWGREERRARVNAAREEVNIKKRKNPIF